MKRSDVVGAACVAALGLLVAMTASAAPAVNHVADTLLGATQVEWVPSQQYAGFSLTVSGPQGVVERTFGAGENPIFDLASVAGPADGLYNWELTASPVVESAFIAASRVGTATADGKRSRPQSLPPRDSLIQSGYFRVVDGGIFQPSDVTEAPVETQSATAADKYIAAAAQVINNDLIVIGSECVGMDCSSSENFGFDTLRLKENNLRINFADTSNSGSFPTNDWRLVANDSANGGRNIFYLEDSNTGREVLSVEAGAPSNALYVDDAGNLGLGTSTPVVEIHVKDGDTPTLRLEQDNSSGFTAQTWDVAGNETNFFVRDVNNGSKLPFRIRPGAPESSIDIAANGTRPGNG